MSKSNVVNLLDKCESKLGDMYSHADAIVNYQVHTPHVVVIQNHLNNIRATYGDDALREVVILLGLDKEVKKTA